VKNPVKFFEEVKQEGGKVTWPTKNETISVTLVTLILVALSAVFFLFADWVIFNTIQFIMEL